MLGAGLIKVRGDAEAWERLRAMEWQYETRPVPAPLSRAARAARGFHRFETASNHAIELLAPLALALAPAGFGALGRAARAGAGVAFSLFQLALLAGGNLAFLNVLTLVPHAWLFDDAHVARARRRRARGRRGRARGRARVVARARARARGRARGDRAALGAGRRSLLRQPEPRAGDDDGGGGGADAAAPARRSG